MPLTPFHLGPALLLGSLAMRRLDLPTLLIASVVVDVRAALVLFGPLEPPVHGILTTFLGGTIVALLAAVAVLALPARLRSLLDYGRLARTDTPGPVVVSALVGVYSHVVLDSMLYLDARPLFPFELNPFLLGAPSSPLVYGGCVFAGFGGLGLLATRLHRRRSSPH